MKKHILGILALVMGVAALGLAVIPGIALDRPFPAAPKPRAEPAPPPPPAEPGGGVTFRVKQFSVTLGGSKKKAQADNQPAQQAPPVVDQPIPKDRAIPNDGDRLLKWFTIAAVSCSLIGLILGPISWAREKQPALSGSAMGICCLALVWHYVVMGIAVGVAVAVIVILLSHFAG